MKLALMMVLLAAAVPVAASDPDFSTAWHDGHAEVDGYRWSGKRYGEERTGQAVAIYVTEPFSESKRVKADDASRNPADTFDVLKLNLVRDFQTGIYDYNTMVSLFVRSDTFAPVKISFSSAEWCGHVYDELVFRDQKIQESYFSYFEDESMVRELENKKDGVSEENLFILLRGLRGDFLKPGESKDVPFLPGIFHRRLTHENGGWITAKIQRLAGNEDVTVPAGVFPAMAYRITTSDGREGQFHIEVAHPHRLVRWNWEGSGGEGGKAWLGGSETGELAGSARLKYWELHDNGHESYLDKLGLKPLPGRR